jgi:hypothetical protein
MGEGEGGDGGRVSMELTQPLLVKTVPDVDVAIRSTRGKCIVTAVEAAITEILNISHMQLMSSVKNYF